MGLRWLITGGCGFIGANLIKALSGDSSNAVRVLDNLSVGARDDISGICDVVDVDSGLDVFPEPTKKTCQLVTGDILDENVTQKSCNAIDVVVHLAANTGVDQSVENPRNDCETNVLGTLNLLEASRQNKVKRFIFASSGAPVGECEPPIHEELPPHPVSPYGASKLACEGYCSAYYRTYGLDTVVYRFGNVYGPGSAKKQSVVAKFIKSAIDGVPLEIYGDGSQTRDFIYIDDLVNAIMLASVGNHIGGEVFQIATNHETSLHELMKILVDVLEMAGLANVDFKFSMPRQGDVMRNYSDTRKIKNCLGWAPATSLQDGLQQTVNWFVNSGYR